MDNIAYLITKEHFEVEEVNFELLKSHTNNVILEYKHNFTKFRRALFELDRLGFNIGIYNIDSTDKDLILYITGFNIKLGIWFTYRSIPYNQNIFNFNKIYFIIGIREDFNFYDFPKWGIMGDIEYSEIIKLDFIREPIQTLKLNTDFVKIYNENDLKPILSTGK